MRSSSKNMNGRQGQICTSRGGHFEIDAEPLKLAYVMMAGGLFQKCELSWVNPDPRQFEAGYVLARDAYLGKITGESIGSFEGLCRAWEEHGKCPFVCTCALNDADDERINLAHHSAVYGKQGYRGKSVIGLFFYRGRQDAPHFAGSVVGKLTSRYHEMFRK